MYAGARPLTGQKGQCLAFNRKGGCSNKAGKCPNGKHVCTVCGATDHGASWHTPDASVRVANKRVREELGETEMTPLEKAANLGANRSDGGRKR